MTILYHYCSTRAFTDIVSTNSIWLSSLSLSNDSAEGKLVSKTFDRIIEKEMMDAELIGIIRSALLYVEEVVDGLAFCLSKKPDSLSQWRGYASDGAGFCIGFNLSYFEALQKENEKTAKYFDIKPVLYNPDEHEKALQPTYETIKQVITSGQMEKPGFLDRQYENKSNQYKNSLREIVRNIKELYSNLYVLKNRGFLEEEELRLISFFNKEKGADALFRTRGETIVPYKVLELKTLPVESISRILVGPKNTTPKLVIERFLEKHSLSHVDVERSEATYR